MGKHRIRYGNFVSAGRHWGQLRRPRCSYTGPFSLFGAVWLLYILGYNFSIVVWVGQVLSCAS